MESFDAVIFDMDGVLVDSEVITAQVESEMFAELEGVTITVSEIYEHFVGLSEASMIEMLRRDWSVELPDGFRTTRLERIAERFDRDGRVVAGIDELVPRLAATSTALAVASSSLPESIAHKLSVTGLDGYFGPHLYLATMVAHGKPAPDLFLYAAAQLDVDPARCVVIEDSAPGVTAGKAAGMQVIGFTAAGHCGPDHGERLLAAGADHHAASADDLADLLEGPNARVD